MVHLLLWITSYGEISAVYRADKLEGSGCCMGDIKFNPSVVTTGPSINEGTELAY